MGERLGAVIFDMDETLVDWSEHEADWDELRRQHFAPLVEHLVQRGHELPEATEIVEVFNSFNRAAWESSREPDWVAPRQLDLIRRTLRAFGIDVEEEELREIHELYAWGAIPGVHAYPDSLEVLRALSEHGIKTGLVTNASAPMWMRDRELEKYGLLPYLDVRVTAGDAGHLKPHPRAFEWVLERLGIRPEQAVFVGDSLRDDVEGAKRAGMRAVWINRRNGQRPAGVDVEPDATIYRLSDLLRCLDEWYPGWRDT